jgi:hypothetical protein
LLEITTITSELPFVPVPDNVVRAPSVPGIVNVVVPVDGFAALATKAAAPAVVRASRWAVKFSRV